MTQAISSINEEITLTSYAITEIGTGSRAVADTVHSLASDTQKILDAINTVHENAATGADSANSVGKISQHLQGFVRQLEALTVRRPQAA